jgi:hypothetical protein
MSHLTPPMREPLFDSRHLGEIHLAPQWRALLVRVNGRARPVAPPVR